MKTNENQIKDEDTKELHNSMMQQINRCLLETSRVFINFKHEIEIEYERIENAIELANKLLEAGRYDYVKVQLHYLEELIVLYKNHYKSFLELEKDIIDKIKHSPNVEFS